MGQATCERCKAAFEKKNGKKRGKFWYCGYCDTVIYGKPDSRWLPKLERGEHLGRGFHED